MLDLNAWTTYKTNIIGPFIKRAQELGFSLDEVRDLLALRIEPGKLCRCHEIRLSSGDDTRLWRIGAPARDTDPHRIWLRVRSTVQRAMDRDKTVTKLRLLSPLGLALSEKQIPQVVENFESGDKWKKALERANMRPRQVRYQAALRPDNSTTCVD